MIMATKDQEEHKDKNDWDSVFCVPVLKNDKISDAFLNLKFNSTRIKIRFEIQDKISAVVAVAIVYFSSTGE